MTCVGNPQRLSWLTALCLVHHAGLCLGRTWGQLVVGTRLVDACTLEDASVTQFFFKIVLRWVLSIATLGLFLLTELMLMIVYNKPGSSIIDDVCGTRVVIAVKDAPK